MHDTFRWVVGGGGGVAHHKMIVEKHTHILVSNPSIYTYSSLIDTKQYSSWGELC